MRASCILVVDDDPRIRRFLQVQLSQRGYNVKSVDNGRDALLALADEEPDVVLLDVTMPGMDGLEVCRQVREWSSVPIILLTAIDTPETKIQALESGADDYITKPFHTGELIARIRAVLRRTTPRDETPAVVTAGDVRIDLACRRVLRGSDEVQLTKTEFELLGELVTHRDRVVTYDHLLNTIWGVHQDDIRTVHVHIANLRRKLRSDSTAPFQIQAVSGVGYRFCTDT